MKSFNFTLELNDIDEMSMSDYAQSIINAVNEKERRINVIKENNEKVVALMREYLSPVVNQFNEILKPLNLEFKLNDSINSSSGSCSCRLLAKLLSDMHIELVISRVYHEELETPEYIFVDPEIIVETSSEYCRNETFSFISVENTLNRLNVKNLITKLYVIKKDSLNQNK